MRRLLVALVASGLVVPALPAAASDACVDTAVKGALTALPDFTVAAMESGGGARVVLKRENPALWLMLSAGFRENGLNTFAFTRGEGSSSRVPPALETALNQAWERLGNDPAAKACDALRMPDAPVAEQEYERLDKMFQALQPTEKAAGETPADEGGGWEWLAAMGAGLLALVLWSVGARMRRRKAAPPPAPVATPPAPPAEPPAPPAEPPAEPPAGTPPSPPDAGPRG